MLFKKFIILIYNITFLFLSFAEASRGSTGWIIFRKLQSTKLPDLVSSDLSDSLYNPSALAKVAKRELLTTAELGLTEDRFAGIIYAHPIKKSAISFGILHYDAGKITFYYLESEEEKEKTVKAQNDLLFMVSYGRVLTDKLCIGLTTKFVKSKIAEISEATAFAVDTGGLYFVTDSLVLTAGVYNLGTSSKFLNIAEKLPLSLSTAIFYTAKLYRHFYFRWCIDLTYIIYETLFSPIVSIGVGGLGVDIFFGYKFNVEEGSFRVGINLSLKDFEVSYVFIPTSLLDSAHRMSFGIKF